jgi:hypothetical protein
MSARAYPPPEPTADDLAAERAEVEFESDIAPAPSTIARSKLRRYVEAVGIAVAVRRTGIPQSTLLALRLGRRDDPKISQVLALEKHAGIDPHDWARLVPACRPSAQK